MFKLGICKLVLHCLIPDLRVAVDILAPFFICWPSAKFLNHQSLSTVLENFENFVSVRLPVCRWSMAVGTVANSEALAF